MTTEPLDWQSNGRPGTNTDAAVPGIESYDTAQMTCPYYRSIPDAHCVSGCREEPSCQADQPLHGWKPRDRRGRYIHLTGEQMDTMAQNRWDTYLEHHPHLLTPAEPMMSFEQKHFGRDITCRGVYEAFDGRWFAYDFEGTFQTMRTSACDTEAEARHRLLDRYMFADRFCWQMWTWMNAGDCAPRDGILTAQKQQLVGGIPVSRRGFRNVLRVDGCHYIPRSIDRLSHSEFRGFGGRMFRWRWLDEPEGAVHFSNDVFTQGDVPEKMQHLLPDNAVFVKESVTGGER